MLLQAPIAGRQLVQLVQIGHDRVLVRHRDNQAGSRVLPGQLDHVFQPRTFGRVERPRELE
jgi:hypothetical protein